MCHTLVQGRITVKSKQTKGYKKRDSVLESNMILFGTQFFGPGKECIELQEEHSRRKISRRVVEFRFQVNDYV